MILVCGSRGWHDPERIRARLGALPRSFTILHGAAHGADQLAGAIAAELGFDVEEDPVTPEEWREYGPSAGHRRNARMLDRAPRLVIAFWDCESRGTLGCIKEARRRGIEVEVIPL